MSAAHDGRALALSLAIVWATAAPPVFAQAPVSDIGRELAALRAEDLVAGSGLRFEDQGKHALDGVAGDWRLFAVERRVSRIPNS